MRIVVIGGTGYAGGHIAAEAAERGHEVVAVSRTAPATATEGVTHATGSLLDAAGLAPVLEGADAVVEAAAPRGELEGRMRQAVRELIEVLPEGARLGVIGGAGGSTIDADGTLLVDTPDFPEAFRAEAREMIAVRGDLEQTPEALDWFFIRPAAGFGSYAPGERVGSYRTADEGLVADAEGTSFISGADFAIAVVDELETRAHPRGAFGVGY